MENTRRCSGHFRWVWKPTCYRRSLRRCPCGAAPPRRAPARPGILEAPRLQRTVAQGVLAPAGHDLHRHTALEDHRVLKAVDLGLLGRGQRLPEGVVLLLRHGAVALGALARHLHHHRHGEVALGPAGAGQEAAEAAGLDHQIAAALGADLLGHLVWTLIRSPSRSFSACASSFSKPP